MAADGYGPTKQRSIGLVYFEREIPNSAGMGLAKELTEEIFGAP